jgi:hypothetical protein
MSDGHADAARFRDLFFGCLGASYPAADLDRMVAAGHQHLLAYLPQPATSATPPAATAQDLLAALDGTYRAATPLGFYRHAVATPASPVEAGAIDAALRRMPMTVVIFPGVFSEFIETKPFHELFALPRATAREAWRAALANFSVRERPGEADEALHDEQFELGRFDPDRGRSGFTRRPLDDLVAVSSLDDATGQPLVRAILLVPGRLSLETVDDFPAIATILSRRLGKVFSVLGLPEHIVFLGYSMGAPVGLEVLSAARATRQPWAERVHGFIAVGGVIFGSHAADDALRPVPARLDNLGHRELAALRTLADSLRVPHGSLIGSGGRLATIWRNGRAWLRFGTEWAGILEQLVAAGPKFTIPTLVRLGRKLDLRPAVGLAGSVVGEAFSFQAPVWHTASVARFKRLVDGVLAAVEGLSTDARLRWWRTSQLPTQNIRYYAVAGTLSDGQEGEEARDLSDNDTTYNPGSLDDEFLRNGYREFVAASAQRLNDSQVAVARAQFWPALAALLNPTYRANPLKARFLGVLGVHHWGLALREVNKSGDGSTNPFPRLALLKALVAQVAMDL